MYRIEFNTGLHENPSFDLLVVDTQQVKRPTDVVLLTNALRRVALNLCTDAAGNVQPLAQAGKRPAQAVQRQPLKTGSSAGAAMRVCWPSA